MLSPELQVKKPDGGIMSAGATLLAVETVAVCLRGGEYPTPRNTGSGLV